MSSGITDMSLTLLFKPLSRITNSQRSITDRKLLHLAIRFSNNSCPIVAFSNCGNCFKLI